MNSPIKVPDPFSSRRWLCEKHKVSSGGYSRYPDRYLTERLGLVRLPLLKRRYPCANA